MSAKEFLTPPAVARLLGIGLPKLMIFISRGDLPAANLPLGSQRARYLIARTDLDAFLESRKVSAVPAAPRGRPRIADAAADGRKVYY